MKASKLFTAEIAYIIGITVRGIITMTDFNGRTLQADMHDAFIFTKDITDERIFMSANTGNAVPELVVEAELYIYTTYSNGRKLFDRVIQVQQFDQLTIINNQLKKTA